MAIDTSPATCTGHQPSGRRSFRKQRTVNPLMVPARYNFLYSSSRPANGRPPAALGRQAHIKDEDRRRLLTVRVPPCNASRSHSRKHDKIARE
jgi:hypothetical protein